MSMSAPHVHFNVGVFCIRSASFIALCWTLTASCQQVAIFFPFFDHVLILGKGFLSWNGCDCVGRGLPSGRIWVSSVALAFLMFKYSKSWWNPAAQRKT